jgi:putative peptidoglycan binding protein
MPSPVQNAWVKSALGIDIDAAPSRRRAASGDVELANALDPTGDTAAAPAPAPARAASPAAEALAPVDPGTVGAIPIIPIIVVGVKTLTGELTAAVSITNNTKFTLTLDTSSLKFAHGELKTGKPQGILNPNGGTTSFVAHSIGLPVIDVSATPCEGTIRYFVGDKNTVWSCHFNNPRLLTDPLGTNSADATVQGPNATGLQQPPFATATHGSDGTFTFTLDGSGGDQPVPPGPSTEVAASCRVSVVNQTQQTIFLRKQDKAAGDYVTNPATSLAPGASTQFVFAETPNSKDHGCRGLLSWDIGDPKQAQWDLMWDNPKGTKNLSAGTMKPDDGSFHSLDQIDDGDQNVPVTFTLSGGGGAGPGEKPTSCAIMVKNATNTVIALKGTQADSGAFQARPPATIAAGQSALVTFVGASDDPNKGAKGSMQWDVGDPKAAAWTCSFDNPPGPKNSVAGTLDPTDIGFKSDATTADGDDDVAMTFTISGEAVPTQDDDFVPPPKSKQPTLRKGDDNSDGWVEYAQRLLNKNKMGVTVNGNFDAAMEAKVKQFQAANACQADGVIGNETWSVLREGPKEKVGTDGRAAHSFEERGPQGRFVTERPDVTGYDASEDLYFMFVVSTGEQPIDDFFATIKVTQPDGTSHTHKIKIGKATSPSPDGQGNIHSVQVRQFKQVFKLKPGVDPIACTVDAYLDDKIGGDRLTGPVTPPP